MDLKPGDTLILRFREGRGGAVLAHVGGQAVFPARDWPSKMPPPKPGEEWLVKLAGRNNKNTALFVSPIKRVNSE